LSPIVFTLSGVQGMRLEPRPRRARRRSDRIAHAAGDEDRRVRVGFAKAESRPLHASTAAQVTPPSFECMKGASAAGLGSRIALLARVKNR
jgi:hypothetical protein